MFKSSDLHEIYMYLLKALLILINAFFISHSIVEFLKHIGYSQPLKFRLHLVWAIFTIITYIAIMVSALIHF